MPYIGDRGCSSPTRRWPSRIWGPFGLESDIDFDHPSGTNARRPSKVIHWEWCTKFKFVHINKWYKYNLESILENEIHKILWDLVIQTDHLISARRSVNKKKKKRKKGRKEKKKRTSWRIVIMPNRGLCRFGWPQGKTGGKWKAK